MMERDSGTAEWRTYEDFLHRKVEIARMSMKRNRGRADHDVEADFARRRSQLLDRARQLGR